MVAKKKKVDDLELTIQLPVVLRPGGIVRCFFSNSGSKVSHVHWRNKIVRVAIYDSGGKRVSLSAHGKIMLGRATGERTSDDDYKTAELMRGWAPLQGGEKHEEEFKLWELFDLSPGEYSLDGYIIYRLGNWPQKKLELKGLRFRAENVEPHACDEKVKKTQG